MLVEIGPLYGYFPNGSKTHVRAMPQYTEGTGIVSSRQKESNTQEEQLDLTHLFVCLLNEK